MKTLFVAFCMAGMLTCTAAFSAPSGESLPLKARYENRLKVQEADAEGVAFQNRIGRIDGLSVIATNHLPLSKTAGIPVDFTQIQMAGYTKSHQVGMPQLPVKTELIEIPQGATPRVEILQAKYTDIDLAKAGYPAPLFPAQAPVSKSAKESPAFQYDAYIYAADAFVGSEGVVSDASNSLAKVEILGQMRGTRLGRLSVTPFFYNPVTHTLRVYTVLDFEVVFEDADMAATYATKARYQSPYFRIVEQSVVNPISVPASKAETYTHPIRYQIVSDPMFRDSLQQFVEWKTRLGFDVREAYTDQSEVGNTKESIRAYLLELYENATEEDPAPTFVLFVGDLEQIPTQIYQDPYGSSSQYSDLYLCDYTGDYLPEVQYGRMSATSVDELMPQIRKTMEMENIDPERASFMDTTVLIAGHDSRFNASHLNPTINYLYNEYFKDTLDRHCYVYLAPESRSHSEDIIQNINNGASVVTYTAHGNEDCWGDPYIGNSDVNYRFTNKGKYPFMVGNCCLTGKFDVSSCFGETLLRKNEGGAVAYIGASNSSYFDHDVYWAIGYTSRLIAGVDHTYEDTEFGANDALFHTHGEPYEDWALTAYEFIHAGNMAVELAAQGLEEYYWQIYHVFGDPSFMPYTHAPQRAEAEYNTTLVVGESEYEVNTEPYARVVLSQGKEILAFAMADASGHASLSTSGISEPGNAVLAVVAQNYTPLIAEIELIAPDDKYVVLSSQVLADAQGDTVRQLNYGGNYTASYALRNVGVENVSSVQMTLSSTDEYLTIENGTYTFEQSLAPGAEAVVEHGFGLVVSPLVPDNHTLTYKMDMVLDGASDAVISKEYKLTAYAPDVVVSNFRIVDSSSSQPNGVIDNGETVTGVVTFVNNGRAAATDVSMRVSSADAPYLSFPAEPVPVGTLEPGASATVRFEYSASDGDVMYKLYTLDIAALSQEREMVSQVQSYIAPVIETFESGDFSFAPWDGTSTWIIDQSRSHNGTYSAASADINDGETSTLKIEVTLPIDDMVGFYYSTSSELANSILGDFLNFHIDGTRMGRWAGENPEWTYVQFPLAAGTHTLEWSFVKDVSESAGEDRVWVDDIRLPIGSVAAVANETGKEMAATSSMMTVNRAAYGELTLTFQASENMQGDLYLLNAMGQKVMMLENGLNLPAGVQTRTFSLAGLASGLYICVFETPQGVQTVKFVLAQ